MDAASGARSEERSASERWRVGIERSRPALYLKLAGTPDRCRYYRWVFRALKDMEW
jgi:hypothetical protein